MCSCASGVSHLSVRQVFACTSTGEHQPRRYGGQDSTTARHGERPAQCCFAPAWKSPHRHLNSGRSSRADRIDCSCSAWPQGLPDVRCCWYRVPHGYPDPSLWAHCRCTAFAAREVRSLLKHAKATMSSALLHGIVGEALEVAVSEGSERCVRELALVCPPGELSPSARFAASPVGDQPTQHAQTTSCLKWPC